MQLQANFSAQVLATICEELPPDGVLLIYLSASGKVGQVGQLPSSSGTYMKTTESIVGNFQSHEMISDVHNSSPSSFRIDSPTYSSRGNLRNNSGCLWMGSRGNGGINCLYPSDLIPFTRRPLFLIIDSDCSQAFKAIHGAEQGEPAAILLSPSLPSPAVGASVDSTRHPSGSQFTMFLTAPLQAFCLLLGFSGSNIEMDVYNKAEKLLSSLLNEWGLILATSELLDPVWAQILCDPFLRRLILRFIFCRTVIALYAPTFQRSEFLPECLPHLPESVLPATMAPQSAVLQIANIFGVTDQFVFTDKIVLPEIENECMVSPDIKASDSSSMHFAAENGH
ncbi:Scai-like protein [Thalictrum thalictroides]|uniref:Scai-like protein n=1 Tax=Thalictrum thalictroides TaxID=46969 RepID=A0A7J6X703_THATH|nr:Scai-like protein [Thalictrum thalictroides]